MNQGPQPGSVEHFFTEVLNIIKQNAQGDVRVLIVTETSTNQFWLNGQVPSVTWLMGMLKRATIAVDCDTQISIMEKHEQNLEQMKQMQLKAMETPEGKPQ
jgi:hypothetical protein